MSKFNRADIFCQWKRAFFILFIILFLIYFFFSWLYKLDILPGLHGDEAWSGLKADHFIKYAFDQVNGMNYYSGILQASLAEVVFRFSTESVFNLRIGGPLFNIVALVIMCCVLLRHNYYYCALAFFAILSQSALYLSSPRVAWEVNTFTLFFLSLLFISGINIVKNETQRNFWPFILLLTNILGAYNHIIFSAVPLALFLGLCLWTFYTGDSSFKKPVILLALSIANIVTLYFVMTVFKNQLLFIIRFLPFIMLSLLIFECWLANRISHFSFNIRRSDSFQLPIKLLLATSVLLFLVFHGKAFLEVLAGYKIYLQNYSFECPLLIRGLLITCATVFILYFFKYLWQDLQNRKNSVYAFIIIAYMGVFNLYTVRTSFRYYLAIYAIISIYVAFKWSAKIKAPVPLIFAMALSITITSAIQFRIFINNPKSIRAVNFKIGNGQTETSAHFLPKEPLIFLLRYHHVSYINYLNDDPYFLALPIEFYKLNQSWSENVNNRVSVGYDYVNYKNGYVYYLEY